MQIYPGKFEFGHPEGAILSDDSDYRIVDSLTRGICDVYFDPSGSPEDAMILISGSEISSLRKELEEGGYEKNPALEKVISAILEYAKTHPPINGGYCFVCTNY